MRRLRAGGVTALGFGAVVCAVVSCGGDDGPGGTNGAGAVGGEAGESGVAAEAGRAGGKATGGTSGKGGTGGAEGGASGSAGMEAQGGDDGGSAGADTAGQGGSAGSEVIELVVSDEASELIVAADGGSVTLGLLTLVIPPDALAEDTEITIQGFEESDSMFLLEPDGLVFEAPITARFDYPPGSIEGLDEVGATPLFVVETAALGEAVEVIERSSVEMLEDGTLRGEVPLEHFSLIGAAAAVDSLDAASLLTSESYNVEPATIPFGGVFTTVSAVKALPLMPHSVGTYLTRIGAEGVPLTVTPRTIEVVLTDASGEPPVYAHFPASVEDGRRLSTTDPVFMSRNFSCEAVGEGRARVYAELDVAATVTTSGFVVQADPDQGARRVRLLSGPSGTRDIRLRSGTYVSNLAVTCEDDLSVFLALGLYDESVLAEAYVPTQVQECYWHSTRSSCEPWDPALSPTNVVDTLLTVGPDAAARLEADFPCGSGPVGQTFCATAGAFAIGDYVLALTTFGDDVPLDDAARHFQHAFVFDADLITSNNYVPPDEYPDDSFKGTDKWYQLFYEPGGGFSVRVVDARISTSNPVASNARFVIVGRELAVFIPRSELDGDEAGYRVASFWHYGDYGLDGGLWGMSYYPLLDAPLMPAADTAFVLPEN